ncbi:serine hydrolase [Patescibacteria group bacterium]|nr:serine hydrolase [Patescibacteria group bacterium]
MKKILLTSLILIVTVGIVAGTGFLAWNFLRGRSTEPPQKLPTKVDQKQEREQKIEVLVESMKEITSSESPSTSFSLAVYDITHGEYFGFNDEKPLHAASVSKLLTATYVFDQTEKGKVNLADPMGAYNVETQIKFLINQSSQDSWDLLDERFNPIDQNKFAKGLGLSTTDVRRGKNLMSPKDVATLLKQLVKGEILTEGNRNKLFSYMQNTESEDFFSPALKLQGSLYYHKTGKYLGEGHDAAIVQHPTNPFVLVVFSNNNTSPNLIGRGSVMIKIADMVYEYFDGLGS